jgi:hypothetical protein
MFAGRYISAQSEELFAWEDGDFAIQVPHLDLLAIAKHLRGLHSSIVIVSVDNVECLEMAVETYNVGAVIGHVKPTGAKVRFLY